MIERNTLNRSVAAPSASVLQDTQTRVINQVYTWMSLGLALTATVGYYTAGTEALRNIIFSNGMVLIGLVVAQLGIVFALSAAINRLSAAAATGLFILYAALTLSLIHI